MLTSTSLNASFIAKLVHASNVAIATESYCEVVTSKGKASVLVEWNKQTQSLVFTHVSGHDVTALVWRTINQFVVMPAYVEHVQAVEEHDGYQFLSFYLLFVVLVIHVALGLLSLGYAVLLGGFIVILSRIALPVLNVLKTERRSYTESTLASAIHS